MPDVTKGDAAVEQKYLDFDVPNELGNITVDRITVCRVIFLHDS